MRTPAASTLMTLENRFLAVACEPARGARLISFRDLRSGREWLLQEDPAAPGVQAGPPAYGSDFSLFHCSGFDECFPNVSASPEEAEGLHWPDHGELWTTPWRVEREAGTLTATAEGRAWPYTFTRTLRLEEDTLVLDYRVENRGADPLPHLWSAHPLLRVQEGMRIVLPEAVDAVFVNWSSDPALGAFGDRRPWPLLAPGLDLSTVAGPGRGLALKLFVERIPSGRASLVDPGTGEALAFAWDCGTVPHLGLWLCYGGWPTDGRPGHFTVALEPASGMPDSLEAARALGLCPVLDPGASSAWTLKLRSVPSAIPSLEQA